MTPPTMHDNAPFSRRVGRIHGMGYTASGIARTLGVSTTAVSQTLIGKSRAPGLQLRIAEAVGLSVDDLYGADASPLFRRIRESEEAA